MGYRFIHRKSLKSISIFALVLISILLISPALRAQERNVIKPENCSGDLLPTGENDITLPKAGDSSEKVSKNPAGILDNLCNPATEIPQENEEFLPASADGNLTGSEDSVNKKEAALMNQVTDVTRSSKIYFSYNLLKVYIIS